MSLETSASSVIAWEDRKIFELVASSLRRQKNIRAFGRFWNDFLEKSILRTRRPSISKLKKSFSPTRPCSKVKSRFFLLSFSIGIKNNTSSFRFFLRHGVRVLVAENEPTVVEVVHRVPLRSPIIHRMFQIIRLIGGDHSAGRRWRPKNNVVNVLIGVPGEAALLGPFRVVRRVIRGVIRWWVFTEDQLVTEPPTDAHGQWHTVPDTVVFVAFRVTHIFVMFRVAVNCRFSWSKKNVRKNSCPVLSPQCSVTLAPPP